MTTDYFILIPSSESKISGGYENKPYRLVKNKKEYNYFMNELWIEREKIYSTLRETISKYEFEELEKLFKLKGENLQEAISKNEDLLNSPTLEAITRYSGTMYKTLNYKNLTNEEKENLNDSVLIIDGLFGILKGTDLIPDYKLKIETSLIDINLIEFWKNSLQLSLSKISEEKKFIIDLLPNNHRKIIEKTKIKNLVKIEFKKIKNGKIINLGHNSKVLRGELIKFICKKKEFNKNNLIEFNYLGFKFNKELSTENIVFTSEN